MMNDRPTKKQQILLKYIGDFIKQHGYGPSYREIMRGLDYKSVSTVAVHVDGLIARGWLQKRDHSARSLEVTSPGVVTDSEVKPSPQSAMTADTTKEQLTGRCDELLKDSKSDPEDILALIRVLRLFNFGEIADKYHLKHEQFIQNRL